MRQLAKNCLSRGNLVSRGATHVGIAAEFTRKASKFSEIGITTIAYGPTPFPRKSEWRRITRAQRSLIPRNKSRTDWRPVSGALWNGNPRTRVDNDMMRE